MRFPCCLCLCIPSITVCMSEPIYLEPGRYIMSPKPISKAYSLNLISLYVSMYTMCKPFIVTRQRVGKNVPASTNEKKTKLHGLRPRANYTDRATAACRQS
jgi:hypothetical protein